MSLRNIFIVTLLVFSFSVFSQEFNSYLITNFSLGEGNDQLGFKQEYIPDEVFGGDLIYAPRRIAIFDNEIYIIDIHNSRIQKFDLNGTFLESYPVSNELNLMDAINFRVNESFFAFTVIHFKQLVIINRDNREYFSIDPDLQNLDVYTKGNFFLVNDNVIFHNDADEYSCYNHLGERISVEINVSLKEQDFSLSSGDLSASRFISEDNDNRLYWVGYNKKAWSKLYIMITTRNGVVVTYFENPLGGFDFSVDSQGNIYYLKYSPDGVELWRTDKNW